MEICGVGKALPLWGFIKCSLQRRGNLKQCSKFVFQKQSYVNKNKPQACKWNKKGKTHEGCVKPTELNVREINKQLTEILNCLILNMFNVIRNFMGQREKEAQKSLSQVKYGPYQRDPQ